MQSVTPSAPRDVSHLKFYCIKDGNAMNNNFDQSVFSSTPPSSDSFARNNYQQSYFAHKNGNRNLNGSSPFGKDREQRYCEQISPMINQQHQMFQKSSNETSPANNFHLNFRRNQTRL
jgi:hypothetical protein